VAIQVTTDIFFEMDIQKSISSCIVSQISYHYQVIC